MDILTELAYQFAKFEYLTKLNDQQQEEDVVKIYDATDVEKKYKKTGYHQKDTQNNNYKDGISNYRQKAFRAKGRKCSICGATSNLRIHHKDGNRRNNSLGNLKVICESCHQKQYHKRHKGKGE